MRGRLFSVCARRFGTRQEFISGLASELQEAEAAGLRKRENVIESAQGAWVRVTGRERPVLNMCANNYLGLGNHPTLVEAAHRGLDSHGLGVASVRFICGTQDIHRALEKRLAAFHQMEDAILFPSCFDANGGIFEVLLGPEDAVISDALNHASIIDGVRLCKAQRYRYANCNLAELEQILRETQSARRRLVVSDGVFSMDGIIAPLPELAKLCQKYEAILMIDECHATGFLGEGGIGTKGLNPSEPGADIISSTLGKALGGATGGYIAGPHHAIELLRNRARPYLFSNSVAPAVVSAGLAAMSLIEGAEGAALRGRLAGNVVAFRHGMNKAGLAVGGDPRHPICPVHIPDASKAGAAARALLDEGVYAVAFSYPVVPAGKARIRVQVSAAHSADDIQYAVQAFSRVKSKLNL